ncbi:MAG: bifunctional chorismate mutase/prephenate dehydrogenase [Planctomycetota bacterium]
MAQDPAKKLASLRSKLDRVDEKLCDLVAERLVLAADVARLKAESGAPLFHRDREEALVHARRESGRVRGVDPELTEDIFRRLILESHKWQSTIIRETKAVEPRRIAVIGGHGGIGSFFVRFLESQGHEVLISDLDTDLSAEDAASEAEVVIVSVPIKATQEVIERVGPKVDPTGLLMDVTSLKQFPVRAMLEHSECEVIGAHPMFGPSAGSIHRQVIALCPARGELWLGWLKEVLLTQGAELVECTPEEHDRAMAAIQVLRHAATMAFGRTLRDLGVDIDDSLRYSSPIYRLELMMTGRLFGQDPELYADLGLGNENRAAVADAMEAATREIAEIVRSGDRERFLAEFGQIASYFDGYSERALEQSSALIERMVERM